MKINLYNRKKKMSYPTIIKKTKFSYFQIIIAFLPKKLKQKLKDIMISMNKFNRLNSKYIKPKKCRVKVIQLSHSFNNNQSIMSLQLKSQDRGIMKRLQKLIN